MSLWLIASFHNITIDTGDIAWIGRRRTRLDRPRYLPLLTSSCVSTPEQLAKWDDTYNKATNTIARVEPVIQTVTPPPWNALAEAALGLFSAGLATWNVQQHRRLAALEAANPASMRFSPNHVLPHPLDGAP